MQIWYFESEVYIVYTYAMAVIQEAIQVAAMCDKIKQSELYKE